MYTQKEAEEGKILPRLKDNKSENDEPKERPVNYPVGKPLEVC